MKQFQSLDKLDPTTMDIMNNVLLEAKKGQFKFKSEIQYEMLVHHCARPEVYSQLDLVLRILQQASANLIGDKKIKNKLVDTWAEVLVSAAVCAAETTDILNLKILRACFISFISFTLCLNILSF